jgi:hypothetical protein
MIAIQTEFDDDFWVPAATSAELISLGWRGSSTSYAGRHLLGFILIGEDFSGTIYLKTSTGATLDTFTGVVKDDGDDLFVCHTVDQALSHGSSTLYKFTASVATDCQIIGIFA